MTNEQKLVFLTHSTEELIKAEEKAAHTGSMLHKEDARKKRNALKIWIAGNRLISSQAPVAKQKPNPIKKHSPRYHWIAQ
jgi:hypothetical protein